MEEQIYIVTSGEFIKIGITTNMKKRLSAIQTGNPMECKCVYMHSVRNARKVEGDAHRLLADHAARGEWFKCSRQVGIDAINLAIISPLPDEGKGNSIYGGNNSASRSVTVELSKGDYDGLMAIGKHSLYRIVRGIVAGKINIPNNIMSQEFLNNINSPKHPNK